MSSPVDRAPPLEGCSVLDETLRDGLQSASIVQPSLEEKLALLHLQDDLGIEVTTIGLPRSSERVFRDCLRLCQEVAACRMRVRVACAARTVREDILPIIELSQRTGVPIEVYTFIASSPIRQYIEGWDVGFVARRSADAIDVAVAAGLPVAYVTEDTTRSRPAALRELFKAAIDHGATRLCLADTVGHATPDGTESLVAFTRQVIAETGARGVGIDWHGHNDRGLALANALRALAAGADRIHATALGIGERVGNVPMELLLLNMGLLGRRAPCDPAMTRRYVEAVARAVNWRAPAAAEAEA